MLTLDKSAGMMVGLAVGDALGAPLEFMDAREPDDYITKYVTGGHHDMSIGEWTDDTAMALAMADSLSTNLAEFNPEDMMHNWYNWYMKGEFIPRGKCFDIGTTTQDAIEKWINNKSGYSYNSVSFDDASGNGALMRLAPAVIASATPERAMELAIATTILTHGSPKCIEYGRVFAHQLWHGDALQRYQSYNLPLNTDRKDVMSGGYVVETYQCAMWAYQTTNNFADCVIKAVNRGHDSDTCGAVAGMIAGAHYGLEAIPSHFKDDLMWYDKLVSQAFRLYNMRR